MNALQPEVDHLSQRVIELESIIDAFKSEAKRRDNKIAFQQSVIALQSKLLENAGMTIPEQEQPNET